MALSANVVLFKNDFIAELNDGRRIEQSGLGAVARELFGAGVRPHRVHFEWRTGTSMITAGKQAALRAEISRMEKEEQRDRRSDYRGLTIAA